MTRIALFLIAVWCGWYVPVVVGGEPVKPATIDDDLFEGLPPAEKTPEKAEPAEQAVLPGEDIDLGGAKDPFARIATKMQRSRQALVAGNSQEETQDLQKEILTDLDALLKSVEKKCSGGNCKKPGSSSSSSASAGQKPGSKPASDSTARIGKPGESSAEENAAEEAIREVWGHLPPKLREAMQNASLEEFLPKYDGLIKEFYRRLAEDPARGN